MVGMLRQDASNQQEQSTDTDRRSDMTSDVLNSDRMQTERGHPRRKEEPHETEPLQQERRWR